MEKSGSQEGKSPSELIDQEDRRTRRLARRCAQPVP